VKRRHYSLHQESEFSLKNNHKVGIIASIFTKLCIVSHFAGIPAVPLHEATQPYSIAFGQSALLLDTLAYTFKSKGDEIWIA
jgi:CRISPR-associated endonuclease/helicase Cas3